MNKLHIDIEQAVNVKSVTVEKSATASNFKAIGDLAFTASDIVGMHTFNDAQPLPATIITGWRSGTMTAPFNTPTQYC